MDDFPAVKDILIEITDKLLGAYKKIDELQANIATILEGLIFLNTMQAKLLKRIEVLEGGE